VAPPALEAPTTLMAVLMPVTPRAPLTTVPKPSASTPPRNGAALGFLPVRVVNTLAGSHHLDGAEAGGQASHQEGDQEG